MILEDRGRERMHLAKANWRDVLRLKQTWGIILGRLLTDPVWYFITDWFAIYLVARHIPLEQGMRAFWAPFLAADAGNFLGGGVSSWLVRRGWNVVAARKAIVIAGGFGMTLLIPAIFTNNLWALAGLFSAATCCYAAWSTMALTLPSDLYPENWVASVSGYSGAGSGVGTIASTWLIGWTADRYSFEPILVVASLVPLVATLLVVMLVRTPRVEDVESAQNVKTW